jgi:hypothetical protein
VRASSGDLEGARSDLLRARALLPPGSTVSAESHLLMVEADLARRAGDLDGAVALYESMRAGLAGQPDQSGRQQRSMVSCQLARLVAERGDRDRAGELLREALTLLGDNPDIGIFLHIAGGFAVLDQDPVRVATIAGAVHAARGGWGPRSRRRGSTSYWTGPVPSWVRPGTRRPSRPVSSWTAPRSPGT